MRAVGPRRKIWQKSWIDRNLPAKHFEDHVDRGWDQDRHLPDVAVA